MAHRPQMGHIRMEGTGFGGVPMIAELKLEVWDCPNSAGIVIDAVSCANLALDRRMAGAGQPVRLFHEIASCAVDGRGGARRNLRFIAGGLEAQPAPVVTMLFLIRHAAQRHCRHLAGRTAASRWARPAGASRAAGRKNAHERLDAIQASPRERTLETARAVAQACGSRRRDGDALDEVDFGAWSGVDFETLSPDALAPMERAQEPRRAPEGESMLEVQGRVVRHIERARAVCPTALLHWSATPR